MGDNEMLRVMGVLIHGDAAFCGQATLGFQDDELLSSGGFSSFFMLAISPILSSIFQGLKCKFHSRQFWVQDLQFDEFFFQKTKFWVVPPPAIDVSVFYNLSPPPAFTKNQGILAECLQLSDLPAYTTGGTVHFAAWPTGLDEVRGFSELTPLEK